MAVYDRKLGDWFKEVEQLAQELRAKKQHTAVSAPNKQTQSGAESNGLGAGVNPLEIQTRSQVGSTAVTMDDVSTSAEQTARKELDTGIVAVAERDEPSSATRREIDTALFDEEEIPQVEDFLPFLDKSEKPEQQARQDTRSYAGPEQRLLNLSEGTGVPRPISVPVESESPQAKTDLPEQHTTPRSVPAKSRSGERSTAPARRSAAEQRASAGAVQPHESSLEEKWARVPSHLRALFEGEMEEVAQRSYKTFKESRADLIERLLDPTITLEDTARLLNVCPTTVRRYTNKGILKHFRTPGNQRRFKLSDVIAFLESRRSGRGVADTGNSEDGL